MKRLLLSIPLLVACPTEEDPEVKPGPYGMPLVEDGVVYAGVATIDVTPAIKETFTDLNGNALFDGCIDNPEGGTESCPEGFDDLDGDGSFDPVWIGGFDYLRPALDVRDNDGISIRALVLVHNGSYVAFAVGDFIGLGQNRLEQAAALLSQDGFDGDRFLGGSTHNHQGPDTLGLFGDPLASIPGFDPEYQDRIAGAMYRAVKEAASSVEPVDLRVGAVNMRDRGPWFNGSVFGGKNPTPKMHGMIHDIRDPVIVSDQVLAMQGRRADDTTVFTFTNWSGHPEVRGDRNNSLSADWVGVTRAILEDRYGGTALHFPESLGGMQSAFGGELPLVGLDGQHIYQVCSAEEVADADSPCFGKEAGEDKVDADGDAVPLWATRHTWEYMISHGWHIAEAAIDVLDEAEIVEVDLIRVEHDDSWVPVRNIAYNLFGPLGIFDVPLEDAATDAERCPAAAAEDLLGCLAVRTFRVQIGPVTFLTAPGELFPELAWGLPTDDPQWVAESADPTQRGPDSRYFPQHDAACDEITWEDCRERTSVGDCNCLRIHAWPYDLDSAGLPPVLDHVDTPYKAVLSATGQYLSYIIPEPDTNKVVSLFTDFEDHYEDVVSVGWSFGDEYLQSQQRIADRW